MSRGSLSRRSFLKLSGAAAGALAAPYILTTPVLGRAGLRAAGERITLGHIGVGGRGTDVLRAFLSLGDCQTIAVCDPFAARRDAAARAVDEYYAEQRASAGYRACAAYRDFRDMVTRADLDAVVIATPDHWHVPTALAAVRAGKDVYVEKPLGLTLEQDRVLRENVQRYGRVFQYGTQQRCNFRFRRTCELVRSGRIGKLEQIYAWCAGSSRGGLTQVAPVPEGFDYDLWLGPAPAAPYTPDRCLNNGPWFISDYALGFIAGWGAHTLDIAQWGHGSDVTSPVEYEGRGTFPTEGLWDTATAWDVTCTYADGVRLRFMSTEAAEAPLAPYRAKLAEGARFIDHGTLFIGSAGWVAVDRARMHSDQPARLKSAIGPGETHLPAVERPDQDFLNGIRTRQPPINTIEAAVRSDTISHLSEIAIRTGRKIKWDPQSETIVQDEAAARLLRRAMRAPWRL
ncbi:MAG: Gfo/Idh/MocA family oxidoreductase [Planctomycetota bacterium]